MRISLEWLRDYVTVPDTDALARMLETAGFEVDEVWNPAALYRGVVVGEVTECGPHPDSDRLSLCAVSTGSDTFPVVCGAPNVRAGLKIAFAKPGADLNGFVISERKIRGQLSQGMICAKDELGIGEKRDHIWELPDSATVGNPFFEEMKIEPVLTLAITPNRGDALSHLGIAREVAAASGQRAKAPAARMVENGPDAQSQVRIAVEDPQTCSRYSTRLIRKVKVGPSPEWLQRRLEAAGQRSINNVVDATNYVMFALGQPMHAFDWAKLSEESGLRTISVRFAQTGETLETLDGEARELQDNNLVIADSRGPIALAGVMGGANSEVTEQTTDVLLESACFAPDVVRRSAKVFQMHSDSSHRFERGTDPEMVLRALDRCAQIISEVAGGEVSKGHVSAATKAETDRTIELRLARVSQILGAEFPEKRVVELLEPLEIRCVARTDTALRFEAPTYRNDLHREADLIEEVARRHGFHNLPESLPGGNGRIAVPAPRESRNERIRDVLLACGVDEVVTYGFGAPADFSAVGVAQENMVGLLNPLGDEFSILRPTLLPSLLRVAAHNERHGSASSSVFEFGTTFSPGNFGDDAKDALLPVQKSVVGLLLGGRRRNEAWHADESSYDFADLAGVLENLDEAFGLPGLRREPDVVPGMHPHVACRMACEGRVVGWAGQVHPRVAKAFDLSTAAYYAEFEVSEFPRQADQPRRYTSLGKFPGTRRDVALVASQEVSADTITRFIEEHASDGIEERIVDEVRLFDVYRGKPIPDDRVSLAFAIFYRSQNRTLTDDEVSPAFTALLDKLESAFEVSVRRS